MTEKDRADYLIKKFGSAPLALLCVEEILSCAGFVWGRYYGETALSARDTYRKYWNSVKSEIEAIIKNLN